LDELVQGAPCLEEENFKMKEKGSLQELRNGKVICPAIGTGSFVFAGSRALKPRGKDEEGRESRLQEPRKGKSWSWEDDSFDVGHVCRLTSSRFQIVRRGSLQQDTKHTPVPELPVQEASDVAVLQFEVSDRIESLDARFVFG
jgi:hypothetical protein